MLLMLLPIGVQAQSKKTEKSSFRVYGNCEMCKMRIEKAALQAKGVKRSVWNMENDTLVVWFNPKKTTLESIQEQVAAVGHDTQEKTADAEVYANLPMCCLYERPKRD